MLLAHLLTWQLQPGFRGNSWRRTIREQRRRVLEHLDDNPSLRAKLDQAVARAWRDARAKAQDQTSLAEGMLPADCPFGPAQIVDPEFPPG